MPPSVPNPDASTGKQFGIKVSKTGVPVQNATPRQLNYTNDFQKQTFYAADGSSISIGILDDGGLGLQILDQNGNEVMRAGYLPESGIYGWAVATPGNSLEGQV